MCIKNTLFFTVENGDDSCHCIGIQTIWLAQTKTIVFPSDLSNVLDLCYESDKLVNY
jgi:hypothetical protein